MCFLFKKLIYSLLTSRVIYISGQSNVRAFGLWEEICVPDIET